MIGDGPLETLESAVADVVSQYQKAWGRRPTKAEWEALLHAVLGSASSDEQLAEDGIMVKVQIELKQHGSV